MPLPVPKSNEKKEDFIGRCISVLTKAEEFDSKEQRIAVCFSQFKKANESTVTGEVSTVSKRLSTGDKTKEKILMLKNVKAKKKIQEILKQFAYIDTLKESSKIDSSDIIDMFGGEKFFKKGFKTTKEAIDFIYNELSTFDLTKKDIDEKTLEKGIRKFMKK